MEINTIWDRYSYSTKKVSFLVRIIYCFIFGYSLLYSHPIKYLWCVISLDILQYTYLALYYQVQGYLRESNIDIGHKGFYLMPADLCFYGKVLVLLFLI